MQPTHHSLARHAWIVLLLCAMAIWLVVEAILLARNRTPPAPLVPEPSAA